jgi:AraC family transcriptional regulator of adaptative response/methylated-DNA-[protein]-cysteine methyltransferase
MFTQQQEHYQRIETAIGYIREHFREQPSLEEVAKQVHLSPFHFQRLFTEWAGTTPKKFLQYISIEHAKKIMIKDQLSVFDTAFETGLSGTSRLHDLFVSIEGMTPAEYRDGGRHLQINYSFADSPFGQVLIASTPKGVCHLAFEADETAGLQKLMAKFPQATYQRKLDMQQQHALFIFQHDWSRLHEIKLHLKGTPFQLKVWESLLKIPMGRLATYSAIANTIAHPKASRAVGTAVGDNPVAFLIPCHRVIQSTGIVGQYHWGTYRKSSMIGWEASQVLL